MAVFIYQIQIAKFVCELFVIIHPNIIFLKIIFFLNDFQLSCLVLAGQAVELRISIRGNGENQSRLGRTAQGNIL
jgi:hypothetical protein